MTDHKREYNQPEGGVRLRPFHAVTPDPVPPRFPPPPWLARCCACQRKGVTLYNCKFCKHWTCVDCGIDGKYPMCACHRYVVTLPALTNPQMFVASEAFGTMGMMNNTDAELTDSKELIGVGVRRGAILLYMPTSYLSLQWIMKIPHC